MKMAALRIFPHSGSAFLLTLPPALLHGFFFWFDDRLSVVRLPFLVVRKFYPRINRSIEDCLLLPSVRCFEKGTYY